MTIQIKLSKRQKQLLAMLDKGMSNKDIAAELALSEYTIKVHMWRLYQRIGVNSRLEAAKWWRDHQPSGLVFALRAAFDAACRLVDGGLTNTEEFNHHRKTVMAMEGGAS